MFPQNLSPRWTAPAVAVFLVCAAPPSALADNEVTFQFSGVSGGRADAYRLHFLDALKKVRAFWGDTFQGEITVDVSDGYRISRAIVPAWHGKRGFMEMPARRVQTDSAATTHELIHVFAPNGNRFLAEGFAVYAHERLGGAAAFPNFDEDLHRAAAPLAERVDLATLDGISTPTPLGSVIDEKEGYLIGGSFVRFLIETQGGMEKFRALYTLTPLIPGQRSHQSGDPGRWQGIYGKPLSQLEAEWNAFLKARFP